MKVFIDARILHVGGTLTFTTNLLSALLRRYGEQDEFHVLYARGQEPPSPSLGKCHFTALRSPAAWIPADLFALPRLVERTGADIFHSLKRPQMGRVPRPRIITLHSAYPFLDPSFQSRAERIYWTPLMRRAAADADAVVVVSETDRENVVRTLGLPAGKVFVVPCACDPRFRPVEDPAVLDATRQRHGLPDRYVLFVGNAYRPKNLPVLIRAFDRVVDTGDLPHHLVWVGGKGCAEGEIRTAVGRLRHPERFLRTGPITDDLPAVYSAADLFVFPTLYDSFGMPVLEAMACGTPVIVSSAGALVEVAGDAAEVVDPGAAEAIAAAIVETLGDPTRREALRERGRLRVREFSWDRSAERTMDVYRRVLRR